MEIYLADSRPDLAWQLVDRDLAKTLTAGSRKKVHWRCPLVPRHIWKAAVYSKAKGGAGCPVCAGKRVDAGDNDLATTHPEIAKQLVDPKVAATITAGSSKPQEWRCPKNQRHEWTSPTKNRVSGRGCPVCANRKILPGDNDIATTHPALAEQLVNQMFATTVAAGSTRSVRWRCPDDPSHEWEARLFDRMHGNGCPICSGHRVQTGANDLGTTHPELAEQLVDPEQARHVSKGSEKELAWRCRDNPLHVWTAAVYNRVAGNGCAVCVNQVVSVGTNDLSTTHPHIAARLVDPSLGTTVTAGSKQILTWQCQINFLHTWPAACYHLTSTTPTGCPKCFGPAPSGAEASLALAVGSLVDPHEILPSYLGALEGQHEIDIYIPALKLGIEFNGIYWHSDMAGKTPTYHADKTAAARKRGIQLIHVWEDDWRDRPEIVLRALAHRLDAVHKLAAVLPGADHRISETKEAYDLRLDAAGRAESKKFLGQHHLQGVGAMSRVFVARDHAGGIRALLGLSTSRNSPGDWEIKRYATLGSVPGGFAELLAYAERVLRQEGAELNRWIAFSSNDICDGAHYKEAGFTVEGQRFPECSYAGNRTGWTRIPKKRLKQRFRQDPTLQWHESWTLKDAIPANSLSPVYDAGKTQWAKDAGGSIP